MTPIVLVNQKLQSYHSDSMVKAQKHSILNLIELYANKILRCSYYYY